MARPTILAEIEDREVWQWTAEEVARAIENGILADAENYELIEGRLIRKMAKGEIHILVHTLLIEALIAAFSPHHKVRSEAPLSVSRVTEPEPDLLVIPKELALSGQRPHGDQATLAVEISDSSAKADLGWKRDLYASAGVPEYWVVDVNARRAFVHRRPIDGEYRSIEILHENDELPGLGIPLGDVLPKV